MFTCLRCFKQFTNIGDLHDHMKNIHTIVNDPVEYPAHYTTGKIEVIDFIEDQKLDYHEGNVVKYVCRAPHKGRQLEDLKKARWYLDRKINKLEAAQ